MTITLAGYALLAIVPFSMYLTYGVCKQLNKERQEKIDYIFSACIWMLLFAFICMPVFIGFALIKSALPYFNGDRYQAEIISYTKAYQTFDDSDGFSRQQLMYTPIVVFRLVGGKVLEKELEYSSSVKPRRGEKITIFYNEATDRLSSLRLDMIAFKVIMLFVFFLMLIVVYGAMQYAHGKSVQAAFSLIVFSVFNILFPAGLLIAFAGLAYYIYQLSLTG